MEDIWWYEIHCPDCGVLKRKQKAKGCPDCGNPQAITLSPEPIPSLDEMFGRHEG